MKKYIVTAYYIEQYQLDFDPAEGEEFWIKWGTLYKKSDTSDELLEFEPVFESDHKYPNSVEVEYTDAIADQDE